MIHLRMVIRLLTIAAGALMVLNEPAYAYLDPGSASILLQAAIGAVAAAGLFFRQKIKRFFLFFRNSAKDNPSAKSKNQDKGLEL